MIEDWINPKVVKFFRTMITKFQYHDYATTMNILKTILLSIAIGYICYGCMILFNYDVNFERSSTRIDSLQHEIDIRDLKIDSIRKNIDSVSINKTTIINNYETTIKNFSISQRKYIINKDTIVGYTFKENRKIAVLFIQGDKYKAMTEQDSAIIENYKQLDAMTKSNINGYKQQVFILKEEKDTLAIKLNQAVRNNEKLIANMAKERSNNKIVVGILGGTTIVSTAIAIIVSVLK